MTTPTSVTVPAVEPGQVWADNDARSAGRTLRIDSVDATHAACTVLTNSIDTQEQIDAPDLGGYKPRDMRGKTTRVALRRFRPTSTGYILQESTDG